jgi:soluble lytic murein transglycosylase-like protein
MTWLPTLRLRYPLTFLPLYILMHGQAPHPAICQPSHKAPTVRVVSWTVLCRRSVPAPAKSRYVQVCAPSSPYDPVIQKAARATGLDPRLIRAVIAAESQFHAREVSPAGACGLMQLMPRTARLFSVKDIFDPEENIMAGCKHLSYLLRRFSNDLPRTLAAYNAGECPVLRYKGIPPFPETQQYVKRVLRYYQNYVSLKPAEAVS